MVQNVYYSACAVNNNAINAGRNHSMTVQQLCQQCDNAVPMATAWQYSHFGNSVAVQPLWQQLSCSVKWKLHLDQWQQLLSLHSKW